MMEPVAGGMNKRADHGPLSERVARSRGEDPAPAAAPPSSTLKHCWVTTSAGRQPGLLLEWRRRPDGWHARVLHPVPDGDGWAVVEEWLPTALLEPAHTQFASPTSHPADPAGAVPEDGQELIH